MRSVLRVVSAALAVLGTARSLATTATPEADLGTCGQSLRIDKVAEYCGELGMASGLRGHQVYGRSRACEGPRLWRRAGSRLQDVLPLAQARVRVVVCAPESARGFTGD